MMMICSLTNEKEDVMAMSHEDGATTRLGHEEFKEVSKIPPYENSTLSNV
jgi:hypothetical protein